MARHKYSEERIREAVAACDTYMDVLRYLGATVAGGTHAHIKRRVQSLGLSTSHFVGSGWNTRGERRRGGIAKKSAEQILTTRQTGGKAEAAHRLRRALAEIGREYRCAGCGIPPMWNGKPLTLEIDHINGDRYNNLAENLRYMCPNCHAQTETFRTKNRATKAVRAN